MHRFRGAAPICPIRTHRYAHRSGACWFQFVGRSTGLVATVDQTLIRGLGPHDNNSSEGCLALLTGISRPSIIGRGSLSCRLRCPDLRTDYLLRQVAITAAPPPDKADPLARDRSDHYLRFFPSRSEAAEAPTPRICAFQAISRTGRAT